MSVLRTYSKHAQLLVNPLSFITLLVLSPYLKAEQQLNDVATPMDFNQVFSVIFGLGFVLLLFFILVYALKRLPSMNGARAGVIKIIDTLYLSNSEKIVLVKIGEQQLLLGITPQKIESLGEIHQQFDISEQNSEAYLKSFSELISERLISGGKKS